MKENLFVYGTLKNKDTQQEILGRHVDSTSDTLTGYTIRHDMLSPYPVATPAENSTIEGLVLDVSKQELQLLDAYEGEPYVRVQVILNSERQAWVYVGNPQYTATPPEITNF